MSFQQGLSGLNASSQSLDVIGHNIANAGTYGNKSSRAEFADMYANSLNGAGASQVGIGVRVAAVTQQFTQGSITTTESAMDLAINGSGFFQFQDDNGSTVYGRNGQLQLDKDGFVVNAAGQELMGYAASDTGTIVPSTLSPLQLPTGGVEPHATTGVELEMNLDSTSKVTKPSTGSINFDDESTYNYATSATVFDNKGQSVSLTYYFQKTADNTWDVYATANDEPVATDANGNPAPSTTLAFDPNAGPLQSGGDYTLTVAAVTLKAGGTSLPISGVKMNFTHLTENAGKSAVTSLKQDGYAPGQLAGLSISENGTIVANYSNGQSKAAGQVVMANFRNVQGLQPLGGNVWRATYASGEPVNGTAGSGNFGVLQSGALEESNVDMTAELVNMITAQRAYQANSQTIKTQDQVLQTLVNLR